LTVAGGAPSAAVPVYHSEAARDDARARWRLDTVVIDAGHGGHDAGAIGPGGLREKDVVLQVALRVGRYLEALLGVNVVYTRQDDRFITLRDRGRIANAAAGKLFISIHANAAYNRSAQGTETYFLGMHKTEAAERVMERENSVIQYEKDPTAYDGLDQRALIEQALAQSAYMRSSEELAGLVQEQFTGQIGRIDRGVKQAGFYVLWGASMPAVLVELGFITNAQEAAFLQSENGQIYLASAIFRAVRSFKTQYEKGLDLSVHQ
jgi:N-acetylmuramoyl-L-alanine amidase